MRRLEERAGASGTDWGLGALANARALLADDADLADSLYTEAIERLATASSCTSLAPALQYGEWLRRVNRRIDCRLCSIHDHGRSGKRGTHARHPRRS